MWSELPSAAQIGSLADGSANPLTVLSTPSFEFRTVRYDPTTGTLTLSWNSAQDRSYTLRSVITPGTALPSDRPVYEGRANMIALLQKTL